MCHAYGNNTWLSVARFCRDVEEELSWLSEKEPLVSSADLGSSLAQVQSLPEKPPGELL